MCYTVPLLGAVATSILWKKKKGTELWWLNLMFYGAALFGVIDHLWNGELLFISENWLKDLSLGVVITIVIFAGWITLLTLTRINPSLARCLTPAKE